MQAGGTVVRRERGGQAFSTLMESVEELFITLLQRDG